MAADPARARFLRAVYQLVVGTGAVQERVSTAWLELMPLQRDDLPEQHREAFAVIEAEMLAAPDDRLTLAEETSVAAATRIFQLAVRLWGS